MNKYFFNFLNYKEENHAGPKAFMDADTEFEKNGYQTIFSDLNFLKENLIVQIFKIRKAVKEIPEGSEVIINYPYYRIQELVAYYTLLKIKNKKKIKAIALIHDILELRNTSMDRAHIKYPLMKTRTLNQFDGLITHSQMMQDWLRSHGVTAPKMVTLTLFDYLGEVDNEGGTFGNQVIIAGNLSNEKNQYMKQLLELDNVVFNLYGVGLDDELTKEENINYMGSFSPAEIPSVISGSYGLIWDSQEFEGGKGNFGNYQRFNNPHKASLYLLSGIPIVIWSGAALAEFISENGLGITIDNLSELPKKISKVSEQDYYKMCMAAKEVAKKLSKGNYLSSAILEIEEVLKG